MNENDRKRIAAALQREAEIIAFEMMEKELITYPPEMLPSPDEDQEAEVIVQDDLLAKRLRDAAAILPHDVFSWLNPLLLEAANEIERLEEDCHQQAMDAADHAYR